MAPSRMKAIHIPSYFPDPSTLRPTLIPTPTPKPNQALIKITHISPQHADILHAQGKHQNNNPKKGWCHPPFILGYSFGGIIISLPSSSSQPSPHKFRKGDRVFGGSIGAFAEYIALPLDGLMPVPRNLGLGVATAMSGQAVSYAAVVHVAKVRRGETVLVSGASGGLGSVCAGVAKAVGARVICLAGDEDKAERMRVDMGCDAVFVVDREGKWRERVLEFTGGEGVDVLLDNIGIVNEGIGVMAYFGRIVVLGFAARKGVMEEVKMNKLLLKSLTVTGYRFGESGRRYPDELRRIWEGYLGMLETGELKAVLYGKYEGLEDVGRALKDLEERKVYGKIVVSVADEKEASKL